MTLSSYAGLAGAAQAAASKNSLYHLLYFYMRQGTQSARTQKYLSEVWMPAARRAGAGPMGFFSPYFGERAPYILAVVSYPSFAALEALSGQLAGDAEYNSVQDPPYVRLESELLRAFDGSPAMEVPPTDPKRPARLFDFLVLALDLRVLFGELLRLLLELLVGELELLLLRLQIRSRVAATV